MSDAGKKGVVMEPTTSTWTYTCRHDCRKEIQFDIEREPEPPRSRAWEIEQVGKVLHERGWFVKPMLDNDGRMYIFAYCSVGCHNEQVREDFRRSRSGQWWTRCREFHGAPPACTCILVTKKTNGAVEERRDPECPLHCWLDEYYKRRDKIERDLFERWKDVSIGAIVVERKSGRAGRVSAPPKLLTWSSGRGSDCLVPVDGWAPHPQARDLELPPPGASWHWLPLQEGETAGDRKSKDAPG